MKGVIRARLKEFESLRGEPYSRLFEELCFCLCTPQSGAVKADKAVAAMKKNKCLVSGEENRIRKCLLGLVRFHNKKAVFIKEARHFDLAGHLKNDDDFKVRESIVNNVRGIGYKEASHFLRNIGRARDLAILDVHILKNLKKMGVIDDIPKTLTKKKYYEIEDKMRLFSKSVKIPLRDLDLLFWSNETGHVFK